MFFLAQALSVIVGVATALGLCGRNFGSVVRGLSLGLIANALALYAFIYLRGEPQLWPGKAAIVGQYWLLASVITIALVWFSTHNGKRFYFKAEQKRWSVGRALIPLATGILAGGTAFFWFGTRWAYRNFENLTANTVRFAFNAGTLDTADQFNTILANQVTIPIITTVLAGISLGLYSTRILIRPRAGSKSGAKPLAAKWFRIVSVAVLVVSTAATGTYAFVKLPLWEVLRPAGANKFIENNYVDPDRIDLKFPAQKQNLIHIYLESIENTYYSTELGGNQNENLMPALASLEAKNVSFSNTTKFGGPRQIYGSEYSVAAMLNMEQGIPALEQHFDQTNSHYPVLPTIGSILAKEGYQNEIMLAANAEWGDLKDLYQGPARGNFLIYDYAHAKEIKKIPPDYHVWWGYEDDKLYEFAKEELTRLGSSGKPFYFILENADTHYEDGYVSPRMTNKPFPTQYENVIFYSQEQVCEFIKWVQAQPFGPKTTIVVTGDHIYPKPLPFKGADPDYYRTIVNFIINPVVPAPDKQITQNRQYATFDYFPTTLAAIGVQIPDNRLGLGTNLFSGQPTLMETHGFEQLNKDLKGFSSFYQSHLEPAKPKH